jgi:hypothetical protein
MTDFINFKIKPVQSFRYAHKDMMYVYVLCVFICMSTCVYTGKKSVIFGTLLNYGTGLYVTRAARFSEGMQ